MNKIKIKPLSINKAYRGRRFKTPEYKKYALDLGYLLPKKIKIYDKMGIHLEFGFSNKASDWDNPIKAFVDILQKQYEFDDKIIYEATVKKMIVKKGKEYISFKLYEYED